MMPTSLPNSGQSRVLLQLHPLFSFFQALTLPTGVYASEADLSDYRIVSQPLRACIPLATERTAALFHRQAHVLSKLPEEPL